MTCRRGFIITEGLGGGAIIVRGYGGRGKTSEDVHVVEFDLSFRDLPMMNFEFEEVVEAELGIRRDLELQLSFDIQKRR